MSKPKFKAPISYYGGKVQMIPTILPMIPPHTIYTEPFFGSGAIFFAKEPSASEVINDTNRELVSFYLVMRSNLPELRAMLDATAFSRATYEDACVVYQSPHLFTELQRAWALFIVSVQSFSSIICGSWAVEKGTSRAKAYRNRVLNLTPELSQRLDLVQIECTDACQVIRTRDNESAFHYCDPPYFNSDCGHYEGYSAEDFEKLLITLSQIKGKFLMSSYPSELLAKYTKKFKWRTVVIEKKITVTYKSRKIKQEVLTSNYTL